MPVLRRGVRQRLPLLLRWSVLAMRADVAGAKFEDERRYCQHGGGCRESWGTSRKHRKCIWSPLEDYGIRWYYPRCNTLISLTLSGRWNPCAWGGGSKRSSTSELIIRGLLSGDRSGPVQSSERMTCRTKTVTSAHTCARE